MRAMFTGCGKRGKWLGGFAGADNWEEWLRGDFNAEFAEGTETREERDGIIGLSLADGDDGTTTSMWNGST